MKKLFVIAFGMMLGMLSYAAASSGEVMTGDLIEGTITGTGIVETGSVETGTLSTGEITTGVMMTGELSTGTVFTGEMATGAVSTGTDLIEVLSDETGEKSVAEQADEVVAYVRAQAKKYGDTKRLRYILILRHALESGNYPEVSEVLEEVLAQVDTPENPFYLVAKAEGVMGYGYETDGQDVYLLKEKIENADLDTFEVLPFGYSRDATSVFYQGQVVSGANAAAFTIHQYRCATDDQHMYYHDEVVEEADIDTLEVLDNHYAKDEDTVFFHKEVMSYADPATFAVVKYNPYYNAKDKNHWYKYGKISK